MEVEDILIVFATHGEQRRPKRDLTKSLGIEQDAA